MTQPSRTTESINRDNAAIRDIMHQVKDLTVPDRATLALGLIGHLATMMNRSQMTRLLGQLQEEAERVQDVPPARQRDNEERAARAAAGPDGNAAPDRGEPSSASDASRDRQASAGASAAGGSAGRDIGSSGRSAERGAGQDGAMRADARGVGQAGRGEFRSGRLV